jgi:hypothetical protein
MAPKQQQQQQQPPPYLLPFFGSTAPMASSAKLAQPPPGPIPGLIRALFEFCQLAMSGIESYICLATVSITAEETEDEFHKLYQTFMDNASVMLQHVRRCIERLNIVPRVELDQQYKALHSYKALIACGTIIPGILGMLNNHWENLKKVDGRVLSPNPGPGLYQELGDIHMQLSSIDHSWRTCVNDVKFGVGNSANT